MLVLLEQGGVELRSIATLLILLIRHQVEAVRRAAVVAHVHALAVVGVVHGACGVVVLAARRRRREAFFGLGSRGLRLLRELLGERDFLLLRRVHHFEILVVPLRGSRRLLQEGRLQFLRYGLTLTFVLARGASMVARTRQNWIERIMRRRREETKRLGGLQLVNVPRDGVKV